MKVSLFVLYLNELFLKFIFIYILKNCQLDCLTVCCNTLQTHVMEKDVLGSQGINNVLIKTLPVNVPTPIITSIAMRQNVWVSTFMFLFVCDHYKGRLGGSAQMLTKSFNWFSTKKLTGICCTDINSLSKICFLPMSSWLSYMWYNYV